jgi:hypothetical protein
MKLIPSPIKGRFKDTTAISPNKNKIEDQDDEAHTKSTQQRLKIA